jgi:hypothetical protein
VPPLFEALLNGKSQERAVEAKDNRQMTAEKNSLKGAGNTLEKKQKPPRGARAYPFL